MAFLGEMDQLARPPPTTRNTVASRCKVHGKGIATAIARQPATFTIEAVDAGGQRVIQGGDVFRVDVRGSSVVRARVTDHEDGTYTCKYVPSTSGAYTISVSLHGVATAGSPHQVSVLMPRPDPPQCLLRGEALRSCIAHAATAFEVSFVDALGQTTYAEELDAYVEPLEASDDGTDRLELLASQCERDRWPSTASSGGGSTSGADPDGQIAPAEAMPSPPMAPPTLSVGATPPGARPPPPTASAPTGADKGPKNMQAKAAGARDGRARAERASAEGAPPAAAPAPEAATTAVAAPSQPIDHVWRLAIGPKPLIVRAECSLQSEQVGTVVAGKLVKVREAVRTPDGLRCRIELPEEDMAVPVELTQRETIDAAAGYSQGSARLGSARSCASVRTEGGAIALGRLPGPYTDAFHVCNAITEPSAPPLSTHEQMSTGAFRPAVGSRVWAAIMDTRGAAPSDTATGSGGASGGSSGGASSSTASACQAAVTGWVTAKQANGTVLLSAPHVRVDAGERQQHMRLWAQRKVADSLLRNALTAGKSGSSEGRAEASVGPSFASELDSDEKGIAFAFGGCDPGTLHAKGQLVKWHQVRFSIGLAGKYWLHVGLRQQGVALPGSPFLLTVSPGMAHAPSTKIPTEKLPLQGEIGNDTGAGCSLLIRAADKMGNYCTSGGAPLKVSHHSRHDARREQHPVEGLRIEVDDRGDGTYYVTMRSDLSGVFPISVTIDHVHVVGSPTSLTMLAGLMSMSQSTVEGDGLKAATAGLPAKLLVKCKDRFGNAARRHDKIYFGVALVAPEREEAKPGQVSAAAASTPSMKFEGTWLSDEQLEIRYNASQAGDFELHVWCHPDGTEQREWLMGSPFPVRVSGVRASPSGSFLGGVDAYARPMLERHDSLGALNTSGMSFDGSDGSPGGSGGAGSPNGSPGRSPSRRVAKFTPKLAAGERLLLRPQLRDEYGNASFAQPGALVALMESPEGEYPLQTKQLTSLGLYELSVELQLKGLHVLHVRLDGEEITGSPFAFTVTPGAPVGSKSRIIRPTIPTIINQQCAIVLETVDTFGNSVDVGGANVAARALGTGVSPCEVNDNMDGTYLVTFTSTVVGECRVIVRLGDGAQQKEMAPVAVQFEKKAGSSGSGMDGAVGETDGALVPTDVDGAEQASAASAAATSGAPAAAKLHEDGSFRRGDRDSGSRGRNSTRAAPARISIVGAPVSSGS